MTPERPPGAALTCSVSAGFLLLSCNQPHKKVSDDEIAAFSIGFTHAVNSYIIQKM